MADTLQTLPPHLIGANFLLSETEPSLVYTPEDRSPEDRQMAETAEKFVDKEVAPHLEALEHQEPGLARRLFGQAAELGLLCIEMPEEHGGLGLGKKSSIGVSEQLSRFPGFGITCGAHTGIGSQPLIYFGSAEQKAKYLPRLATGEWMAAYCLSETASGSDALGMKSKAVLSPDGKHYILNGVKMWITNAGWADLFTIFAKVDGQHVTAFLVERSFPGVSTGKEEHKLGIKTSSTRRVILEDVKVPVENVLGEVGKGGYIAFNILNYGRYGLGAGVLGAARDQVRNGAKYALERHQFGRPIASFGLIQQKLADMTANIFAGESATYRTSGMIDDVAATDEMLDAVPRSLDEFALECSILKIGCTEILFQAADECLQIHGGYGYTEEFPAARALRDARINRIFEGTNEINRLFIPGLLTRREQKGRFPLTQTIGRVFKELPTLTPPADTGDDLLNARAFLVGAKKLAFFLTGVAGKKFGPKIMEEQEVLAAISNVIIDIYLGESAVLRALKTRARGITNTIQSDLAVLFVNDSVSRFEASARRVLEASVDRKEFGSTFKAVRGLLAWTPVNSVALRHQIAQQVYSRVGYPA